MDSFMAALNKVTKGDYQWIIDNDEFSNKCKKNKGDKKKKKK